MRDPVITARNAYLRALRPSLIPGQSVSALLRLPSVS
jgi:hypothetical protein